MTAMLENETPRRDDASRPRPPASLRGPELGWPPLPEMDWGRIAECQLVLVGTGAVGRPLAESLAFMGLRRFVLIDPKLYRDRSIVSQCEPGEVGQPKAAIVAQRLQSIGADAIPLVADVGYVEPGYVEPGAIVAVSADNRRAEIIANRLAARMRVRLVKVNVEPDFLFAGLRCYDLRCEQPGVCLECQFTDAQYAAQRPPRGCDGADYGRPTGSPRALCQFAAGAAALVTAQLICSPDHWARSWFGRQWQLNLLTGQATWSELQSNAECRWDHEQHWRNLRRLPGGPRDFTLAGLFELASCRSPSVARLHVSGGVALRARCAQCKDDAELIRWCASSADSLGVCSCGGPLAALSFWTHTEIAAESLRACWSRSLADWGVPSRSIIAVENSDGQQHSFVVGSGDPFASRAPA